MTSLAVLAKEHSEVHRIGKVAAHVPDLVVYGDLSDKLPYTQNFHGVLLFADVSGFTALTEKFSMANKKGYGADQLTKTLNGYIGEIVDRVLTAGGDILNFAGDALLALWKVERMELSEVITLAAKCSLDIQKDCGVRNTEVGVELRVKIGISAGRISKVVVGNQQQEFFVVIGRAVDEVRLAEGLAEASTIILSPNAWELCDRSTIVSEKIPNERAVKLRRILKNPSFDLENYLLDYGSHLEHEPLSQEVGVSSEICRKVSQLKPNSQLEKTLRKYVMSTVLQKIDDYQPLEFLSEMRPVTIMFLNLQFKESAKIEHQCQAMQDTSNVIIKLIRRYNGRINKVFMFDKGCTFLCIFGLPGDKLEDECTHALRSAFKIHVFCNEQLEKIRVASIGVTNGPVFCGVVGHAFRHEYTVIGRKVNLAARLMMHYPGLVCCDEETQRDSKLPPYFFNELPKKALKGVKNPGIIYQYLGEKEKTVIGKSRLVMERDVRYPLLGREKEMYLFHRSLSKFISSSSNQALDSCQAVIFEGAPGYGKSRILAETNFLAQREGHRIDTVSQDFNLLRVDHRSLVERVGVTEATLDALNPVVSDHQKQMHRLDLEVKALQRRALGFPERVEGHSAGLFLEQCLIKEVLNGVAPKFFSVERAHRIPGKQPAPGLPSHLLIARFLNFRDRDAILQHFRNKGPICHKGTSITDFTAEVQSQCYSYVKIKQRLREHNLKYALMFPTRLQLISEERTHVFATPADAWTWMHAKGIAQSMEEERENGEWLSSPVRRRPKRRSKAQPKKTQAAAERAKVLRDTTLHTHYSFTMLRSAVREPTDLDSGGSDSSITDMLKGPEITPRTADEVVAMELAKLNIRQPFYTIQTLIAMYLRIDVCKTYMEREKIIESKMSDPENEWKLCLLNTLFFVKFPISEKVSLMDQDTKEKEMEKFLMEIVKQNLSDEPLVLIIDQAHYIDSFSWQFLAKLFLTQPVFFIMALCPYRHERPPPEAALTLMKSVNTVYIYLGPLKPSVIPDLACQTLGVISIPTEVEMLLIERSYGIPYYCEELLKSMYINKIIIMEPLEEEDEDDEEILVTKRMSISASLAWRRRSDRRGSSLRWQLINPRKVMSLAADRPEEDTVFICTLSEAVKLQNMPLPFTLKGSERKHSDLLIASRKAGGAYHGAISVTAPGTPIPFHPTQRKRHKKKKSKWTSTYLARQAMSGTLTIKDHGSAEPLPRPIPRLPPFLKAGATSSQLKEFYEAMSLVFKRVSPTGAPLGPEESSEAPSAATSSASALMGSLGSNIGSRTPLGPHSRPPPDPLPTSTFPAPPAPTGWMQQSVGTLCQLESLSWLPVLAEAVLERLLAQAQGHLEGPLGKGAGLQV
ncbi:adenylate cyclase type 10 [Pleurodeles waltl]|uniref:adenylate cyclase type 10 n=1 Tax=Pleurodeles waltl TaxID=8319 RepID=UPI003709AC5C